MTDLANLTPPGAKPAQQTQDPLTFIHEYTFPTGPDTSLLTFPLPELIQGALLSLLAFTKRLNQTAYGAYFILSCS